MVDNGSLDDVVDRIRTDPRYASVRVLEPLANLGFAGGCNLGIGQAGDHEFVALLNNDATVDPGWLRAMVPVAQSDDRIGAVAAKMLFADRYHGIEFDVPDASHLVRGEERLLGVRVSGVRLDGEAGRRSARVRRGLPRRRTAAAARGRGTRSLVERIGGAADRARTGRRRRRSRSGCRASNRATSRCGRGSPPSK